MINLLKLIKKYTKRKVELQKEVDYWKENDYELSTDEELHKKDISKLSYCNATLYHFEKYKELVQLTKAMRKSNKLYFSTRHQKHLKESKTLEKQVDDFIKAFEEQNKEKQKTIFNP